MGNSEFPGVRSNIIKDYWETVNFGRTISDTEGLLGHGVGCRVCDLRYSRNVRSREFSGVRLQIVKDCWVTVCYRVCDFR